MTDEIGPWCSDCPWPHQRRMKRGYVAKEIRFHVPGFEQTRTLVMPGWYCGACGDSAYTKEDMKVSDAVLAEMKRAAGQ